MISQRASLVSADFEAVYGPPETDGCLTLFSVWEQWAKDGALPLWNQFDPIDWGGLIEWMSYGEVIPGKGNYPWSGYIRYYGWQLLGLFPREQQGFFIDDMPSPTSRDRWHNFIAKVVTCRRPVTLKSRPVLGDKRYIDFEFILAPFTRDGENVTDVVGVCQIIGEPD